MDRVNHSQMWECQEGGYVNNVQKESNLDGYSYMLNGESTPVRACRDLPYYGNVNKDLDLSPEMGSQAKRRRMLQFDNEVSGASVCSEMPSTFLESKEDQGDLLGNDFPDWSSMFTDDVPMPDFDDLDQSSKSWLAECLNDPDFNCSSENMNLSGASDTNVSELCITPPQHQAATVQERPVQVRRNVVFKGTKSYMEPPSSKKMTSSVVYPFAFVKPCGAHGDITLKDINQRIHTPKKSIQEKDDDSTSIYPTSAFSGKPVVGKTKIRTHRGNGSITIMRTKG